MPMPPPVGEAESNPIMIAVMDAKPITAIVVLVRMGMAATPAATIFLPAAIIFTSTAIIFTSTAIIFLPAPRLSSTLSTAAQPIVADSIPISTTNPLKIIIITWLNIFNQNNCNPFCNSPYLCQK